MASTTRYPTPGLQPHKPAQSLAQETRACEAPFNMRERVDPKFIQFADGESVSGVLVRIEMIEVTKDGQTKKVPRLVIEDLDSNEQFCFLATFQIASKITRKDIGHVIDVRCEGDDPTVKTKGNPMKKFRVLVSDRTAPGWAENGTLITEEDIPF